MNIIISFTQASYLIVFHFGLLFIQNLKRRINMIYKDFKKHWPMKRSQVVIEKSQWDLLNMINIF